MGVPYVFLPKSGTYLCANGVAFTKQEYDSGVDVVAEYAKRSAGSDLYDYEYAKKTGKLRRIQENGIAPNAVAFVLLAVSAVCAVISTVHTAEYLKPYTSTVLGFLMSAAVTAYCTVALEASLLFVRTAHKVVACTFALLWACVTLFSVFTTVAVFWDRFTWQEQELLTESTSLLSAQAELDALKEAETSLRADIDFKRADIAWRQEKDYATTQVRLELNALTKSLQDNLARQAQVAKENPTATVEQAKPRQSVYALVARLFHIETGTAQFAASTLCAVFVNLISPLSVSVASALAGTRRKR